MGIVSKAMAKQAAPNNHRPYESRPAGSLGNPLFLHSLGIQMGFHKFGDAKIESNVQ